MDIELSIDGKPVTVDHGATVMDAARKLGIYIPHFCYHPQLSIAANCRMCLVEVERAAKPLPACATPVIDGMIVRTRSEKALASQHGVMEFLLINHPLDCPICDQGGECQLQDLAVGFGRSGSRYAEEKRVVIEKNLGPLISTEMTRCIHCTRCVRFGQEVAGIMELGMVGRGEHAEIMPFVEKTVDSELSGNVIDLCPVGALTSKPFRFRARTWELTRKPGVAAHDGWGSRLHFLVKDGQVMRVDPRECDEINECWLSDRDRFSYEGLAVDRATMPQLRAADEKTWSPATWPEAFARVAADIKKIVARRGPQSVGFLAHPQASAEELFLLAKIARGLGSPNIDYRLRQIDFRADAVEAASDIEAAAARAPWFGFRIADLRRGRYRNALLVGADPARELPLLGREMRRAIGRRKKRALAIGAIDLSTQFPLLAQRLSPPEQWAATLASIREKIEAGAKKGDAPEDKIAARLAANENLILLGQQAQHSAHWSDILSRARELATACGASLGVLVEGANAVGASLVGARRPDGKNVAQMLAPLAAKEPAKGDIGAFVLLGCEAADFASPAAAASRFAAAELVISIHPFAQESRPVGNVLLPAAAPSETDGLFVSGEGRAQTFAAAVAPPGDARPGWKILRVLGGELGLAGFDFDSIEEVRAAMFSKRIGRRRARADARQRRPRRRGDESSRAHGGISSRRKRRAPRIFAADRCRPAFGRFRLSAAPSPCKKRLARNNRVLFSPPPPISPALRSRPGRLFCCERKALTRRRSKPRFFPIRRCAKAFCACSRRRVLRLCSRAAKSNSPPRCGRRRDDGRRRFSAPVFGAVARRIRDADCDAVGFSFKNHGDCRPAHVLRRLSDLRRAQSHRLYATAVGAESRRSGGAFAADCGRAQTAAQRDYSAGASEPIFVFNRADDFARRRACRVGGDFRFRPKSRWQTLTPGCCSFWRRLRSAFYGVIIAGWASNSKYAFLGCLRSAAQIVSYEIAMGFALVTVLMVSGGLNMSQIVSQQAGPTFLSWNLLPLLPMFVVYFIAGVAETNRAPFDVAEGESEIVAGFHVEYSGMAFAVFFLAEYANMILIAALMATLFLGGWLPPFDFAPFIWIPGMVWLFAKIAFLPVLLFVAARHFSALSLRPNHASRLESSHPGHACLARRRRLVDADATVALVIEAATCDNRFRNRSSKMLIKHPPKIKPSEITPSALARGSPPFFGRARGVAGAFVRAVARGGRR